MKKTIAIFLFVFCMQSGKAQISYRLSAVPESLRTKAAVVTHLETIHLNVESLDEAVLKVRKVFTVVNEKGKDALFFNEYSSKYVSLDEAEIKVYDEAGKQTQKYKKKDMTTVAVGEGLIEDGYVTYYEVPASSYPLTVEFNYQQKFRSTLSFPDYRFIRTKEAVIESNYTAKVPAEISLRYKSHHSTVTPVITEEGKYKIYKWAVNNLSPIEDEEGSVSFSRRFPHVSIVPNQFSHYGLKGDFSSWKSFGNWINSLYVGLDELPAEKQQFFQQLVNDAPDEREKVRRIYRYLQENFRYVSIQLGIGGLKPFSATFTEQKKYGDCKALSNYMKAALKSVGIKSHVAIINAKYNDEPVDPDFPANDFNHVILCVPAKDSIWLECTSSTAEFARLGTFTENRNALLITEDGGVLVPTPKSESSTNTLISRTLINLQNDLAASSETMMNTKGEFTEMMEDIAKDKRDDQKQIIVSYFGYKQPDDFEFSAGDDHLTKLRLALRKLPEFSSGSKHFIKPRINKIWTSKLPTAENRKLDFYFQYPFEKKDTTIIKLTNAFQPDVLPKEKELRSAYSYYQSKSWYSKEDHCIYTATTLILKKHKIAAADYAAVKNFFDEVIQDDSQRIVVNMTGNPEQEKKAF